jgi:hypothetical protein
MFIIDWEFTQFGHRSYDLGQIIGDFYQRNIQNDAIPGIWGIQGVINGYGPVTEEMAFRIAIHTGVHLVGIGTMGQAPPDRVTKMIKFAVELIVKGWEKDKGWFADSALAGLFN